jgi:hypothetical protein
MMCANVGLWECGLTSLTVLSDEADTTVSKRKSRRLARGVNLIVERNWLFKNCRLLGCWKRDHNQAHIYIYVKKHGQRRKTYNSLRCDKEQYHSPSPCDG